MSGRGRFFNHPPGRVRRPTLAAAPAPLDFKMTAGRVPPPSRERPSRAKAAEAGREESSRLFAPGHGLKYVKLAPFEFAPLRAE